MVTTQSPTLDRAQQWAHDPHTGGRILQLTEAGAVDRCVAYFAGKLPDTVLADWCRRLVADAELAAAA